MTKRLAGRLGVKPIHALELLGHRGLSPGASWSFARLGAPARWRRSPECLSQRDPSDGSGRRARIRRKRSLREGRSARAAEAARDRAWVAGLKPDPHVARERDGAFGGRVNRVRSPDLAWD